MIPFYCQTRSSGLQGGLRIFTTRRKREIYRGRVTEHQSSVGRRMIPGNPHPETSHPLYISPFINTSRSMGVVPSLRVSLRCMVVGWKVCRLRKAWVCWRWYGWTLINIYCVSLKPFYCVTFRYFIVPSLIEPYGQLGCLHLHVVPYFGLRRTRL